MARPGGPRPGLLDRVKSGLKKIGTEPDSGETRVAHLPMPGFDHPIVYHVPKGEKKNG